MKERPILFSGPMVRAILDGPKTMTRRIIKDATGAFWDHPGYEPRPLDAERTTFAFFVKDTGTRGVYGPVFKCPHGFVGDRLWVRETWNAGNPALSTGEGLRFNEKPHVGMKVVYKVDPENGEYIPPLPWRSSRFMPRWASRIDLEITDIRVERVQDISETDAYDEGRSLNETMDPVTRPGAAWFRALWDSLNAKRGYGWDANPWVWVITFRGMRP